MNWNERWGDLIIEELVLHDTECFCISPGSRSTPLTLAVAKNYSEIPPKTYAKVKRQIRGSSIDKIESLMKANYGVPDNGWYSDETKAAMKAKIK